MVMRSADDAAAISRRIAELRQEETDRLNDACNVDCGDAVREDGSIIKAHRIDCRHYVATSEPAGFALQQQPRHMPADDRATAKQQAKSPEAAFLQRLHLRIERSRPRSFWAPKS